MKRRNALTALAIAASLIFTCFGTGTTITSACRSAPLGSCRLLGHCRKKQHRTAAQNFGWFASQLHPVG